LAPPKLKEDFVNIDTVSATKSRTTELLKAKQHANKPQKTSKQAAKASNQAVKASNQAEKPTIKYRRVAKENSKKMTKLV
jgi:hypothetical protein